MSSKLEYNERKKGIGIGLTLGIFAGATVGAWTAMLFAPKSGNETRQQLKDLAGRQKDKLKNQWDQTTVKAGEAVDAAKEKLDLFAKQTKNAVDIYADKTKGTVDYLSGETKATIDKFQKHY